MRALREIHEEVTNQKLEMNTIKNNIIQEINANINENFKSLELRTNDLEQKVEQEQLTIDRMERQLKVKNLIIFGIEETEKSYKDLEDIVFVLLSEKMKTLCAKKDVEQVRRIGKAGEKIRPIVVTLNTLGLKIQILKNSKFLEDTKICVKEDFTSKVLQKRKELQEELKQRKEQGENVILKYDKIITLKSKSPQKEAPTSEKASYARNTKRKSTPPSNEKLPTQNNIFTNTAKKNKTTIQSYLNTTPRSSHPTSISTDSHTNDTNE